LARHLELAYILHPKDQWQIVSSRLKVVALRGSSVRQACGQCRAGDKSR
jgi:hypothetical protein